MNLVQQLRNLVTTRDVGYGMGIVPMDTAWLAKAADALEQAQEEIDRLLVIGSKPPRTDPHAQYRDLYDLARVQEAFVLDQHPALAEADLLEVLPLIGLDGHGRVVESYDQATEFEQAFDRTPVCYGLYAYHQKEGAQWIADFVSLNLATLVGHHIARQRNLPLKVHRMAA